MIMSLFTAVPVFASIVKGGTCGDNLTWTLDDEGTLTISGTGEMSSNEPWSSSLMIKNVVIENGVTSIGAIAFSLCHSLTSITIGRGVTSIGRAAFFNCSSLNDITLPDSVTSIDNYAFFCCNNLTSISIPKSITSIGKSAFEDCTSLTNVYYGGSEEDWNNISIGDYNEYLTNATIHFSMEPTPTEEPTATPTAEPTEEPTEEPTPSNIINSGVCGKKLTWTLDSEGTLTISGTGYMYNYGFGDNPWYDKKDNIKFVTINNGVPSIGDVMFSGCSNLTSITIPNSVTSIGEGAFYGCSSLASITIPDNVTLIDNFTFYACKNLTSIVIPDSITGIGEGTFSDCSNLTLITIPDSVTRIENMAFDDCTNLTDVYYGGSEEDWNNISIGDSNEYLTNATIHYNCIFANKLTNIHDNNGKMLTLPQGAILNIGENLNFRNGYVNAENGYVKAGDKKITGDNIYFTNEGKIRMGDGDSAKVERDNGNGTTDQGFVFGILNPTGNIRIILEVTGETSGTDYTGRTITKDFDFSDSAIAGLVNIGFTVNKIPKPLSLEIKNIE